MHLHFERNTNTRCDCSILSLSWMGKVPDDVPEDEGWKLNRTNYYQEGWLATGNVRGIVGVTFTTSHCKKNVQEFPVRTNYNLRGHRSDVILVKWNEPYQKLASCDSSGIIFVWIKYEGRWSIELINDRNTPVTYFSWSHDGRMALICYQDGFVLVGSVAGQRYWSSMLNLDSTIQTGIWTPDDQQVYFGTTQGQIIVMDVHGAMVSQVQLCNNVGITAMAWSCEKFKMEEGDTEPGVANAAKRSFVLAVSFQNGMIFLLRSFDDVAPIQINTDMNGSLGLVMEWSNSRELLAVAGTQQSIIPQFDLQGQLIHENVLKFYTEKGNLLYTTRIPNNTTPVSALTWGHNDKRIFIATGNQVHIAWLSRKVASLQLLCRLEIQCSLMTEAMLPKLPLPSRIRSLIGNLFAQTVRCCVPDLRSLREFVSRPPSSTRLHCTMIRHDDDGTNCYTLYLEYLGGLVPLLKGKRTSKIRPEFVIFDPQVQTTTTGRGSSSSRFGDGGSSKSGSASSRSTNSAGGGTGRSDSSGMSEFEDGPRSPRTPRRKKTKGRKRISHHVGGGIGAGSSAGTTGSEKSREDGTEDELAYLDTLPEEVKLVQVTSNIWGTKFKIHGLKTVPSNLGQVTYKTSLLHLQPRQMTLVITELRDDFVAAAVASAPDPNFNPNVFSEDEEEQQLMQRLASPQHQSYHHHLRKGTNEGSPMIAPMSPRPTRFNNKFKSTFGTAACSSSSGSTSAAASVIPSSLEANLARAESYEDDAPSDNNTNDDLKSHPVLIPVAVAKPGPSYASLVTQYSRSSSSSGQSRHAISPLCCEGSVPTLQSPKNAVAPVDIIFDRPPAAQNTALMSFHSPASEYNHALPSHSRNINILATSTAAAGAGTSQPQNATSSSSAKRKDLEFIDEESMLATPPSAAPIIAPVGINRDAIPRSCSVGYLDSVQMIPSDSALSILRRDAPHKRLILVDKRPQKKKSCAELKSVSRLQSSGKSKSLELFDLSKVDVKQIRAQMSSGNGKAAAVGLCLPSGATTGPAAVDELNPSTGKRLTGLFMSKTPLLHRKERPKACASCKNISPTVNSSQALCSQCRAAQSTIEVDSVSSSTTTSREPSTTSSSPRVAETSSPQPSRRYDLRSLFDRTLARGSPSKSMAKRKTEVIKSYADSPLFNRKHRFQNQEPLTKHERSLSMGRKSGGKRRSSTESDNDTQGAGAPPPRTLTSTLDSLMGRGRFGGRSTPNSPAPTRKEKRHITSSPIRQILNSPLLGGRRYRKNKQLIESSDEEAQGSGGEEGNNESGLTATTSATSRQYRDLETFQKAQLRQKVLKRGKIEPNGRTCNVTQQQQAAPLRREFVMHNKAPMWNENSQVYQLDFGGRVTQESAKNFQIEFRGKQVMQFGRIDGNAYTLDFQYPFSAIQAFGVALANVTQRMK